MSVIIKENNNEKLGYLIVKTQMTYEGEEYTWEGIYISKEEAEKEMQRLANLGSKKLYWLNPTYDIHEVTIYEK